MTAHTDRDVSCLVDEVHEEEMMVIGCMGAADSQLCRELNC